MNKSITRYVIYSESMEERDSSGKWTSDDCSKCYDRESTLDPQIEEVFINEQEAIDYFEKREPASISHARGCCCNLIYFEYVELCKLTFEVDDDVADDKSFDIKEWQDCVTDFDPINIKFSPDEEEDEEDE